LRQLTLVSALGGAVRLRYGREVVKLKLQPGERVSFDPQLRLLRNAA
jgi:hypothetical protein